LKTAKDTPVSFAGVKPLKYPLGAPIGGWLDDFPSSYLKLTAMRVLIKDGDRD
jgi:hypothetical protein